MAVATSVTPDPALVGRLTSQAQVATPLDVGNTSSSVCTLLPGIFGIFIQLLLCLISVLILFFKYIYESPKRPLNVFVMDFIQLMCGSSSVHLLNIVSSILINKYGFSSSHIYQDECNMYFITTLFDATLGVYIEYRIVAFLAIRKAANEYLRRERKSHFKPTQLDIARARQIATYNQAKSNYIANYNQAKSNYIANYNQAKSNYIANYNQATGNQKIGYGSTNKPETISGHSSYPKSSYGQSGHPSGQIPTLSMEPTARSLSLPTSRCGPTISPFFTNELHQLEDDLASDHKSLLEGQSSSFESQCVIDLGETHRLSGESKLPDQLGQLDQLDELNVPQTAPFWSQTGLSSLVKRLWSDGEYVEKLGTWLAIVCGLKLFSIVMFAATAKYVNAMANVMLSYFNSRSKVKLIFVMIVAPLFFNVFQYCVTDSIIRMSGSDLATNGESASQPTSQQV